MRIVHMTSAHPRCCARIFGRMCRSLVQAGHEVHLIVPGDEPRDVEDCEGVSVHTVRRAQDRLGRVMGTVKSVLRLAAALKADLYQFHDPEFLFRAPAFQRRVQAPVVYDAHEDVRAQILYKKWLPRKTRRAVGWAFGWLEDLASRRLGGVMTATASIAERFRSHPHCVVINNYPLTAELCPSRPRRAEDTVGKFAYLGAISTVRSIREMVAALPLAGSGAHMRMAGVWESESLHDECRAAAGWQQVEELAYLDRAGVRRVLESVQAGLVLFHPHPNHVCSQPNKMFEYMSAALPVIASDFPLWREIIDGTGCGLLVDPLDPQAIADAMRWMREHPDEAQAMGQRGRQAVLDHYNWDREFPKLLALYESLVAGPSVPMPSPADRQSKPGERSAVA